MQATALAQGSLVPRAWACLQNVRPFSSQSATHFSGSFAQPLTVASASRCGRSRVVPSAAQEDFADVEEDVKFVLPSVLELPVQARVGDDESSNAQESSDVTGELQQTGTVRQVFEAATRAVGDAPVESVGQAALYGGLVAFGVLVSGAFLNSVDNFPVVPEVLQTVGIVYSVLVGSQVLRRKPVSFPPPSPFRTVVELVDSGQSKTGSFIVDMGVGVGAIMEKLSKERDAALNQAEELRKLAEKLASVVSEKEALEAVALQLADERDGAMSEVSALKDAINSMTNRIKGIEQMLEREVSELKQQNQALETVSLQLAAERDSAVQEIEQLRSLAAQDSQIEAREALEIVAIQLAQERDTARAEIEDLKRVVAILRESSATASGLTPEQEVFIKARVREIRSQFIDVDRRYDDQRDEVDKLIEHLVQEYGAPKDWTADYIKQFLNSSASKLSPPPLNSGKSQVESLAAQTS